MSENRPHLAMQVLVFARHQQGNPVWRRIAMERPDVLIRLACEHAEVPAEQYRK
jgi:hypothetical protein